MIRRPVRSAVVATLLIIAIVLVFSSNSRHVLRPELFVSVASGPRLPGPEDDGSLCRQHGFSPYRQQRRKVYDLILFNHELDWLEVRLNTLSMYVDYFIIVEGKKSFTNLPKDTVLQNNWSNFTAFHSQMLNYVVDDTVVSQRSWDHEDFFRNAMLYNTFPHMRGGEKEAKEGDVLVVSDIDEIPKPETMILLRQCEFPARLTLRSHFYYYSFQWLHRGEQWAHPQATTYRGMQNTISPVNLRNGDGGPAWRFLPFIRPLQRWWQKDDLWSSTWHCSSCFATIHELQTKLERFSHTPWNTKENRDPKTIVERVRNGLDLFGRDLELYDKVDQNQDVPQYVLRNPERYGYLLDRDGPDAAFKDYASDP
ncbi:hypothetical protein LTR37_018403 [Vermiconidia calcicola]|uniref:Uncharacterized protein n=1 Tax=Vermiconidia calcicola TaxID=1690605 RepID=A0ACC3MJY4_9PEZI|nr:hypothetical protein LTR37_018403 [Vermiconidia calcicola]